MNKNIKRLLSLAIVAVMVIAMMPTVFADTPTYTDWDGNAAALTDGAYLKLTADKDITEVYNITAAKVTIDLDGKKITSSVATRIFYLTNGSTLTLKNGTIEAPGMNTDESSNYGGLFYVNTTAKGANELNLENMTITKTAGTSDLSKGGVIYARGAVNVTNSTIKIDSFEGHEVSNLQGGIFSISTGCTLSITGSNVSNGQAGSGGNIFIEGSGKVKIIDSTVDGGYAYNSDLEGASLKGHSIYAGNVNAEVTITNSTVGQICLNRGKLTINSGTINDEWSVGSKDYTITVANGVKTVSNPAKYATDGQAAVYADGYYTTYASFDAAMAAAQSGNTVVLLADATADAVVVPAGVTLNLYGKTLTAASLTATAAGAQVKDEKSSKNAGGKLICDSIAVAEDNKFAPIYFEGAYHFQKIAVAENQQDNVYKFYLSDALDTIYLDDVWANGYGESGLKLQLCASYKVGGEAKEKTFDISDELIKAYAADWENKMFILTITSDLSDITDLDFSVRVVAA